MSIFLFWKIKPDHWLSSNLHCYQSIWLVIWSNCSVLECKNGVSVLLFILINIAKALAQTIKHVLEPTSVFSKAMYVNNIYNFFICCKHYLGVSVVSGQLGQVEKATVGRSFFRKKQTQTCWRYKNTKHLVNLVQWLCLSLVNPPEWNEPLNAIMMQSRTQDCFSSSENTVNTWSPNCRKAPKTHF